MLWVKPLSRRSGSISIWTSEADLRRFVSSPVHSSIVRLHRSQMSGTSSSWCSERALIDEALAEGRRRVLCAHARPIPRTRRAPSR
jgi:hypothetical protein